MPKTIFAQKTEADAEARWDSVADAPRGKMERLGGFMNASRDHVPAWMSFRRELWPQFAGTRPLEGVNREIKRRADVIGVHPSLGPMAVGPHSPTTRPSTAWSAR